MIDRADKIILLELPAFQRFLFALIEAGGVFENSASVGDGRTLFLSGRRSLVLDVLRSMDAAQPLPSGNAIPCQTLIQTLREQVQSRVKENKLDRDNDPYAELRDD